MPARSARAVRDDAPRGDVLASVAGSGPGHGIHLGTARVAGHVEAIGDDRQHVAISHRACTRDPLSTPRCRSVGATPPPSFPRRGRERSGRSGRWPRGRRRVRATGCRGDVPAVTRDLRVAAVAVTDAVHAGAGDRQHARIQVVDHRDLVERGRGAGDPGVGADRERDEAAGRGQAQLPADALGYSSPP